MGLTSKPFLARGHEMNPEVTLSLASLSAPQLNSLRGRGEPSDDLSKIR